MESPLDRVLRLSREPDALGLVELTWSDEARQSALKARMDHSFRTKVGGKVNGHLIHATQHGSDAQMAASEKHNVTAPIGHVLKTDSKDLHGKYAAHAGIPGTTTDQHLGNFRTLQEAHEKVVAHHHGLATNQEAQSARLGIKQGDLSDNAARMHGAGSTQHLNAIAQFGVGKVAPTVPKPVQHAAPVPAPAPTVTSGGVTGPVGNLHPRPVVPAGHTAPAGATSNPHKYMAQHPTLPVNVAPGYNAAVAAHRASSGGNGPTPGNAPSAPKINYNRTTPKPPSIAARQASLVGKKGRTHLTHVLEAAERIRNG